MALKDQTRATKEAFQAQADPDTVRLVEQGLREIEACHPAAHTLGPGDRAPDFEGAEVRGTRLRLADRLAVGPVVLSFYRGGWCPFCSLELKAWQEHIEALRAAGAELIAISPEAGEPASEQQAGWKPAFPVLADVDQRIAAAYGLVFELPESAREAQRRLDADLQHRNADGTWRLPVPATFVIDRSGVIRWAYAAADYTERAEPAEVIAALKW